MVDLDGITTLSDSSLSLVEELRTTREFIKSLKAREAEIRKILLKELQDASLGVTASGKSVVGVERYTRTGLDPDRLQALYEDAWEDCQTETLIQKLVLIQEDSNTSESTDV